jgi:hypothetical protein
MVIEQQFPDGREGHFYWQLKAGHREQAPSYKPVADLNGGMG